jgi:hypothetical protein
MNKSKLVAIAVGLPTSIIGVTMFAFYLEENKYIGSLQMVSIIVINIFVQLYLLVIYANKKSS